MRETIILGAGVTGLAAGIKAGAPIYEANTYPGGICRSYILKGYRFEKGGGHWLFGDDKKTLSFIRSLTSLKSYRRKAAVFFPEKNLYVPYPLQNYLSYLPKEISHQALKEIMRETFEELTAEATFADWLKANFGPTLFDLFFSPFNQLYTAGLYTRIAPQNHYKNPASRKPTTTYNQTFAYPSRGLADLIKKMAQRCQIHYGKKAVKIDLEKKEVFFQDKTKVKYQKLISTLPLNKLVQITNLKPPDYHESIHDNSLPYTSLVVVNIGAKKGKKYPPYHWLYLPQSQSGFYRLGFYSNVDPLFLPAGAKSRVGLYVDKAYLGGRKPTQKQIGQLCCQIIQELRSWEFIDEVELVDPNWIETAYTWSWPGSKWREKVLAALKNHNIFSIGRYGKWEFQGILDSIKEGLKL